MAPLGKVLITDRCPHCSVAHPKLDAQWEHVSTGNLSALPRRWVAYECSVCGGVTLAADVVAVRGERSPRHQFTLYDFVASYGIWPQKDSAANEIPEPARRYLVQALESRHSPDGAVMLAASAVDAMLKARGLREGYLYHRIEKAAADHLITKEMAEWAHDVRLGANDPRHADEDRPHHTRESADQLVEFAKALAEFLFVLPARVTRGRKQLKEDVEKK
ncbi:DUF4145 domain-containing protein [Neoroseomonas rubea]|uniref:DUF4145 domain-containing protein n=1 Tax=Neoroseomonas rubea TaxID=2748666 RepID=UPI0022B760B6|nr:DUF4145 domain-containing protein [Roseomonas rubea]